MFAYICGICRKRIVNRVASKKTSQLSLSMRRLLIGCSCTAVGLHFLVPDHGCTLASVQPWIRILQFLLRCCESGLPQFLVEYRTGATTKCRVASTVNWHDYSCCLSCQPSITWKLTFCICWRHQHRQRQSTCPIDVWKKPKTKVFRVFESENCSEVVKWYLLIHNCTENVLLDSQNLHLVKCPR